MDYEKKHKEEVARATQLWECGDITRENLEYIFPELKESEDERIRKTLITFFQRFPYDRIVYAGTNIEEVIVWLEKQGEQKPVVIIPKFRIGDEIKTSNEKSLTITKIDEKGYWSGDLFICDFGDAAKWELVEQKPVWSEEDESVIKDIEEVITNYWHGYTPDNLLDWLKSLKQRIGG